SILYPMCTGSTCQIIFFYDSGSCNNTAQQTYYTDAAVLTANVWQLVTVTYTFGTGSSVKVYVNGVEQAGTWSSGSGNVAPCQGNERLIMGQNYDGDTFDGSIDEVRVYHRALSAEEVALLYRETHPDDPNANLVGHWTFDGADVSGTTAIDRGRGGNVGTLSGSPAVSPGRLGQALRFDGTDDYVSVAHASSINLSNTISISLWQKGTVFQEYNRSVSKEWGGGQLYGWAIYGNGTALEIVTSAGGPLLNSTDSPVFLYDGSWHHIVWTLDNGNWTYTRDGGVITGSGTYTHGGGFGNTNNFTIGKNGYSASDYFTGQIDDVRIYDTALTATQITDIYRASGGKTIVASSGNDVLTSGLVGQWSMDGQDVAWADTTTEVKDTSGNGSHGNASGMDSTYVVPGRIGQALSFSSSDSSQVDLGTPASLENIVSKTISLWISPSALSSYIGMFGSGIWAFQICSNDGTDCSGQTGALVYYHQFSGTDGKWKTGNNTVAVNQWYHVVLVYDRSSVSNDPTIYVNGSSQGITELTTPTGTADDESASSIHIGYDGYVYFDGKTDDLRVYNTALTSTQVTELYNMGR
ncbi:MAG: LamG domain-containing protein, partial [Candidatus Moraniibacteriota bacterium]